MILNLPSKYIATNLIMTPENYLLFLAHKSSKLKRCLECVKTTDASSQILLTTVCIIRPCSSRTCTYYMSI